MAGVLFIVNVPKKEYEEELKKKDKSAKVVIETDKYETASKVIDELKENKRFGSIKSFIESYSHDDENNIVISKCKSTDCLHTDDKEVGLYKSRSENTLDGNPETSIDSGRKSYLKSSWEEIKQAIKPNRSKLKITQPGKGIDILGAFHWDTPLETILSEVLARLEIINATWNVTKDNKFWQVIFSLDSSNLCEELLQVLRTFGIGSRHQSSISVIPCALYYKSNHTDNSQPMPEKENPTLQRCSDSTWGRFSSSVRARTNLAQVLHDVKTDATLTFDWLFMLIVAAFVAAIGLVENSTIILVASMLISPLMGPITAGTLGTAVRDRSLQQMGVLHELLGLFLSLVIGFIFGLVICAVDERYGVGDWPTYEMMSRCEIRSLWVGVLVAIPSGAGVALAVLGEYTASLVGVAISASLLPPAVNAGLLWAMSLVHLIFSYDDSHWNGVVESAYYSTDQPTELAVLGAVSLCLTLVNIVCIFIAGVLVYKVKEVSPPERTNVSWWRTNRNFLQSSGSSRKEGSPVSWDIYSKWCNEPSEAKEFEKKDVNVESAFGDTVTYRRYPGMQRLRAQNIEACLRKELLGDIYTNLSLHPSGKYETEQCDEEQSNIPNMRDIIEKSRSLDFDSKYSFYNLNFNIEKDAELEPDNEETQRPTIKPSISFTIEPKKSGPVLGSKTFNV